MSDINNKISAKNVFDRHGLSLEGALDVLFSEMEKKEIKRFYGEYREFGLDKLTANTAAIFNGMAAESIAMFSIGSDHALLTEIGAKNPGTLILFKKSGLYFTGGLYFANRSGDVFVGYSGPGGKSFCWKPLGKSGYSLSSFERLIIDKSGYQKLENFENVFGKYSFEHENGTITVSSGTRFVSVCANVVVHSAVRGKKSIAIFKNGEKTPIEIEQTVSKGNCATLSLTTTVIEVSEGDTLDLRVCMSKNDTLGMKTFTVESFA